jgi:hypothetical protein
VESPTLEETQPKRERKHPDTIGSIVVNGTEMRYGDGGFKFGDQKG